MGKNYRDTEALKALAGASKQPYTVNHGKVDISHVSSRLTEALAVIEEKAEIRIGDRVRVRDLNQQRHHIHHTKGEKANDVGEGVVRFVGKVDFVMDDEKK